MTDKELLERIKGLMQSNLLTQAEVNDPNPWGEDGNISSFNYGIPYGAHDLAAKVLRLMRVEIVLEEGVDEDEYD